MDDAKELTGWKKVSQFVYCVGLLFLHFEKNSPLWHHFAVIGWEGGWVRREQ